MKKSLILITLLLLTSCWNQVKEEKILSVKTENKINTWSINKTIESTWVVNSLVVLDEKKEKVESSWAENEVNFNDEEIKEILEKIDQNNLNYFDNRKLEIKQWDFEAKYIKSTDYKKDIDKININVSWKTYLIPWIYNDKEAYLKCIKEELNNNKNENFNNNENEKLLKSACTRNFLSLIDFSPSGYYLAVAYSWWDSSWIKLLNTKTWEEILDIIEVSFMWWTKDKKQFIYWQESWMWSESWLYISINWSFPKFKEITHYSISWWYIDDNYIYIKTSLDNPNYFKVFDIKTLKQVFSKEIN